MHNSESKVGILQSAVTVLLYLDMAYPRKKERNRQIVETRLLTNLSFTQIGKAVGVDRRTARDIYLREMEKYRSEYEHLTPAVK